MFSFAGFAPKRNRKKLSETKQNFFKKMKDGDRSKGKGHRVCFDRELAQKRN